MNFIIDFTKPLSNFVVQALNNRLANRIYLDQDYRLNLFMSSGKLVFNMKNTEDLVEESKAEDLIEELNKKNDKKNRTK